jgi:hypothetical protein
MCLKKNSIPLKMGKVGNKKPAQKTRSIKPNLKKTKKTTLQQVLLGFLNRHIFLVPKSIFFM